MKTHVGVQLGIHYLKINFGKIDNFMIPNLP